MHPLLSAYRQTRELTERLASRLTPEDQTIQSMPDASPVRWHRAHTTWFFENFVLEPFSPGYQPFDPRFKALFNSYYEAIGERHPRPQRGVLSRPGEEEVGRWRKSVDAQMEALLINPELAVVQRVTLGIQHEQQHQELLLTDIKHAFAHSPLRPTYAELGAPLTGRPPVARWRQVPEGLYDIGHTGEGFCFDNELPRHPVYLRSFEISGQRVTNAEYSEFIAHGGYRRPVLWLSDGWEAVKQLGWSAPLYWEQRGHDWWTFTLQGMRPVVAEQPVCHVSFYEAEAYARWAKARLPSEAEWELVARETAVQGNFLDDGFLHPTPQTHDFSMYGGVWQWTRSPYVGYPGYHPVDSALGEYNGKFMSNQMVLRGGSCVSPSSHLRASYRNFFPPTARWQFSGIRLARDR
jgi:ergothioneine biosynthesis protein EgtB